MAGRGAGVFSFLASGPMMMIGSGSKAGGRWGGKRVWVGRLSRKKKKSFPPTPSSLPRLFFDCHRKRFSSVLLIGSTWNDEGTKPMKAGECPFCEWPHPPGSHFFCRLNSSVEYPSTSVESIAALFSGSFPTIF